MSTDRAWMLAVAVFVLCVAFGALLADLTTILRWRREDKAHKRLARSRDYQRRR